MTESDGYSGGGYRRPFGHLPRASCLNPSRHRMSELHRGQGHGPALRQMTAEHLLCVRCCLRCYSDSSEQDWHGPCLPRIPLSGGHYGYFLIIKCTITGTTKGLRENLPRCRSIHSSERVSPSVRISSVRCYSVKCSSVCFFFSFFFLPFTS